MRYFDNYFSIDSVATEPQKSVVLVPHHKFSRGTRGYLLLSLIRIVCGIYNNNDNGPPGPGAPQSLTVEVVS